MSPTRRSHPTLPPDGRAAALYVHCTCLNQPQSTGRTALPLARARLAKPTPPGAQHPTDRRRGGPLRGRRARPVAPLDVRRGARRRRARTSLALHVSPKGGGSAVRALQRGGLAASRPSEMPADGGAVPRPAVDWAGWRARASYGEGPTLELAGAGAPGQMPSPASRPAPDGSRDACRARRSDAAAIRAREVARSGPDAARRGARGGPIWSQGVRGLEARKNTRGLIEAC